MIRKTPLDSWIARKIGSPVGLSLMQSQLAAYQLERIRETLDYVLEHSRFYRKRLFGYRPERLTSLEDLRQLPFTTADDLAAAGLQLLCVAQDEIARVVTLPTSGTSGRPKRLYFTPGDLELTLDFFHHGMSTLVEPGRRVLILLPGERPDSVGELLARALMRMQVEGIVTGPVRDPSETLEKISHLKIDCLVGVPVQVLSLAQFCVEKRIEAGSIQSVLLSTDYIPRSICKTLEQTWNCRVFAHYGMTESGLGGGVECEALSGYHMREADLYFEIIDPETGMARPAGEWGEVVFTTLTRKGMPLVRYRTGDISRFLAEPCACGSVLRRMDRQSWRHMGVRALRNSGGELSLKDLDEALFALPGLIDYRAVLTDGRQKDVLKLDLKVMPAVSHEVRSSAGTALLDAPVVREAIREGALDVEIACTETYATAFDGVTKRTLNDERKHNSLGRKLSIDSTQFS